MVAAVPVVVVTAGPDSHAEGAAVFMQKPFDVATLLTVVARFCGGQPEQPMALSAWGRVGMPESPPKISEPRRSLHAAPSTALCGVVGIAVGAGGLTVHPERRMPISGGGGAGRRRQRTDHESALRGVFQPGRWPPGSFHHL